MKLANLGGHALRVITVALLTAFGACGSDSADETGPTDQEATTTAVLATTVTTVPASTKASGPSECIDAARDAGAQPGSDITKVTLRSDGSTLSVTYDLSGMPTAPADGASWIVKVQVDGGGTYQLGLKLVGREAFRFVFDFGGSQENLSPTYTAERGLYK